MKKDFGDSIKNVVYEYRVLNRLSQKELAEKVGVSKQTIFVVVFLVCDVLFPRTYLANQFLVYKYALALLAGDIYLLIQYRRDYA